MGSDLSGDNSTSKTKLLLIKCPICGEEILVLPDVKMMSIAIESHVKKHSLEKSSEELDTLRDDLISQLFDKIGRQ